MYYILLLYYIYNTYIILYYIASKYNTQEEIRKEITFDLLESIQ